MAITLQTTKFNVIYIYSRDAHQGYLKIGKTSVDAYDVSELTPNCDTLNQAAYDRFQEAATFGVTDLKLLHTEVAHFIGTDGMAHMFDDHAVHEVLLNSNYKKADWSTEFGKPDEWFEVNLENAVKAIEAVKAELSKIDGPQIILPSRPVINFRDEQKRAIKDTLTHFDDGGDGAKMLWNAKMRFGKTLCALELINQMDVEKVMILTHRPTVRSGWFDDYHLINFQHNFQYGSKNGKASNDLYDREQKGYFEGKDLKTLQDGLKNEGIRYIYFASMQDLRGQETDNEGNKIWKDNNKLVYETQWDLIIFDEAHEGTQTNLGKEVAADLCKLNDPLKLYLSGTPYNILSQFEDDEIYTWDYVMEQEAKENWAKNHQNEPNPYEGLARLHIYTYSLGEIFAQNPEYTKSEDDYFNFTEFFRVWSGDEKKGGKTMNDPSLKGHFIHEDDVEAFLDMLCREEPVSFYPYSNPGFRNALSHTLWMLPGVAQANRLACLINRHRLHTEFGYEVVSVAGEGNAIESAGDNAQKIEKQEKDALDRVKNAIKKHPKTITLSCGRLTTGVSVPEWTGVFMLSGGYSTGAANYMQTIFRGQTPYKNGAIKSNCYAFDFAPDRTLTVVNDYIETQRGGKSKSNSIERTDNTLRFMPIVAMVGGQEKEYDTKDFIHKVNQAYTDHVIANGFKSKKLFRNFALFKPEDHELLKQIGSLLGGAKNVAVNSDGTIKMADSGFTGENGGKGKKNKGKKGKKGGDTAPKISKPKDAETRQRKDSQKVLDCIFVRLPLLLFGAVDDANALVVDNKLSIDFIDQESWDEFMPRGFTKGMFMQISHLLNLKVLLSSTDEIIRMAKEADELPIEQRIMKVARLVSKFHFPDKETVLTPWRVVNMHMTDTLGGYDFYDEKHDDYVDELRLVEQGDITANIFCNPDAKILELNSKSGVYPLWIACTLWKLLGHKGMSNEEEWRLWKTVLEKNLYVVCKTPMAEKITRRVLVGYKTGIRTNIVSFNNIIDRIKDDDEREELVKEICTPATYKNLSDTVMLKFNAIVGNPPYQDIKATENSTASNGAFASAIYPLFIDLACNVNPDFVSLITPSRWMTKTGQGISDSWVDCYLNGNHFRLIHDYINASDCFSNIVIKGGVSYFLLSNNYKGKCKYYLHTQNNIVLRDDYLNANGLGIVIRDEKAISVFQKIVQIEGDYFNESNFSGLVGPQHYFDKDGLLGSSWNGFVSSKNDTYSIKYYCNRKLSDRGYGWVKMDDIPKNKETIKLHKIFIPEAGGSGNDPLVLGVPFYGEPNSICSQTYICIGYDADNHNFDKETCLNIITYIKTKFFRYLVSVKKKTQHTSSAIYQLVPLQDFSKSWTDEDLYKKYKLSPDEIGFIEDKIKPME